MALIYLIPSLMSQRDMSPKSGAQAGATAPSAVHALSRGAAAMGNAQPQRPQAWRLQAVGPAVGFVQQAAFAAPGAVSPAVCQQAPASPPPAIPAAPAAALGMQSMAVGFPVQWFASPEPGSFPAAACSIAAGTRPADPPPQDAPCASPACSGPAASPGQSQPGGRRAMPAAGAGAEPGTGAAGGMLGTASELVTPDARTPSDSPGSSRCACERYRTVNADMRDITSWRGLPDIFAVTIGVCN